MSTVFGVVNNSGNFEGAVTETWAVIKVSIGIQEGDGDFPLPPPTDLLDSNIKGSCFKNLNKHHTYPDPPLLGSLAVLPPPECRHSKPLVSQPMRRERPGRVGECVL